MSEKSSQRAMAIVKEVMLPTVIESGAGNIRLRGGSDDKTPPFTKAKPTINTKAKYFEKSVIDGSNVMTPSTARNPSSTSIVGDINTPHSSGPLTLAADSAGKLLIWDKDSGVTFNRSRAAKRLDNVPLPLSPLSTHYRSPQDDLEGNFRDSNGTGTSVNSATNVFADQASVPMVGKEGQQPTDVNSIRSRRASNNSLITRLVDQGTDIMAVKNIRNVFYQLTPEMRQSEGHLKSNARY
jgi:hypothetical protein